MMLAYDPIFDHHDHNQDAEVNTLIKQLVSGSTHQQKEALEEHLHTVINDTFIVIRQSDNCQNLTGLNHQIDTLNNEIIARKADLDSVMLRIEKKINDFNPQLRDAYEMLPKPDMVPNDNVTTDSNPVNHGGFRP